MAKYEGEVLFEQPKAAPVGSSSPNIVPIADGRDTTAKYDAEAKAAQDKLMADAEAHRLASATSSPFQWQGILNSPTALVTGAGVVATLGAAAGYGLRGRLLSRKGATPAIDIPTEASPASMYTAAEQELLNLSERNRLANAANAAAKANPLPQGMTPGVPTGQPNVNANPAGAFAQQPNYSAAPPAAPQSQFDPTRIGQPLQDPLAGRGYQTPPQEMGPRQPIAPSVSETVATGGNVAQAVKQTVANELDAIPSGMRENYKSNKLEPIGPGAFNHLANNVGVEKAAEIWKDVYGEKNVPYNEYMAKYSQEAGKQMHGPVKPLPEGAKPGGSLGTPKYIPQYIRGGVNPAVLAEGIQKMSASPVGQAIGSTVKSGAAMLPFAIATDVKQQNAGYRRELESELKKTNNAERQAQLLGEINKLDQDVYLQSLQRHFINKNIPAALRK
jgi:hypothetical protein